MHYEERRHWLFNFHARSKPLYKETYFHFQSQIVKDNTDYPVPDIEATHWLFMRTDNLSDENQATSMMIRSPSHTIHEMHNTAWYSLHALRILKSFENTLLGTLDALILSKLWFFENFPFLCKLKIRSLHLEYCHFDSLRDTKLNLSTCETLKEFYFEFGQSDGPQIILPLSVENLIIIGTGYSDPFRRVFINAEACISLTHA